MNAKDFSEPITIGVFAVVCMAFVLSVFFFASIFIINGQTPEKPSDLSTVDSSNGKDSQYVDPEIAAKVNVLKNEIKKTVTDGNFVIKKGNIVVNDNDIIGTETSDLTAYSIELTNNSSFIEEVTQPQPQPQNNNVTFTLNVSIPKGYKFRANSTNRVQIVVVKNGLTGKVLKDEIVKTFDDVKFTIKKGTTVISDGDTIGTETSDLNAYYVELLNDSKFIEKVEKQPKEGNEQGEETQVQQEKGKKPCSGKSANCK